MPVSQNINIAYSLNQPLSSIFPSPIVSTRSPLSTDKAQIGTVWVNKTLNDAWILTSVVSNAATWTSVGGGAGEFSNLTVTGNADIGTSAGAIINIGNDQGATAVTLNSGTGNIVLATNTGGTINISGDTVGLSSATTFDIISVGAMTIDIDADPFTLNTETGAINIGTDAFAKTLTLGNITGATSVVVDVGTGALNLGTSATAHATNVGSTFAGATTVLNTPTGTYVAAANGVSISTAGRGVSLPGDVLILSGAGSPDTVVTAAAGSLFLRTDPAGATSRAYINTDGATAWTNITCAA